MSFTHEDGWQCSFLERDLKTPLPKQLAFQDAAKIYETARRGNGLTNDANRHALDRAVEIGRGAIWLYLSDGQYQALKGLHLLSPKPLRSMRALPAVPIASLSFTATFNCDNP